MISSLLPLVGLRPRVYYTLTNFRGRDQGPPPLNTPMSSVMLALYIYIVLDRNKKQNFGNFFCVGLSDNPIWINGRNAMLCRILG